jgi:hypothetical protein
MENILQTLLNGFIVSIIWFIVGGALYMNPFIAGIYKKFQGHESMKNTWKTKKQYLINMYILGILIPVMIASFVYSFLTPISVPAFALILIGIRMVPRLLDMYMQTSYPNKILLIELINGSILSFIGAFAFSLL